MVVPSKENLDNDDIARYHGNKYKGNFFEGWYFKIADAESRNSFAVILGIARAKKEKYAHSFIQILTETETYYYEDFDLQSFGASSTGFSFICQNCAFNGNTLFLDTKNVKGKIRFEDFKPWPSSCCSKGVMEWAGVLPRLGCKYGILNFDSKINGSLTFFDNDQIKEPKFVDYSGGGKGYVEKNWGDTFPSKYLWTQCNDFGEKNNYKNVSVIASIAHLKYLNLIPMKIFVIGVYIDGKLYKFTTASRNKLVKTVEEDQKIEIIAKKKGYRVKIIVTPGKKKIPLYAPYENKMIRIVEESITSKLEVVLEDGEGNVIFSGVGVNAGSETVNYERNDDVIVNQEVKNR